MPITYYPDRVQKRAASPIELLQRNNKIYTWDGGADLSGGDLNASLWPGFASWTVKQVSLLFSSTDPKDYSISKLVGRGILSGFNDELWFRVEGVTEKIYLSPGFYDDTLNPLTVELKSKLDANERFVEMGFDPFTVTFTPATGLFEITPNTGNIQFLSSNEGQTGVRKHSTGGAVLGLTADSAAGVSVISDTPAFGFGQAFEIVSDSGSDATDINLTDQIAMSVDDSLLISSSGTSLVSYLASYKED